MFRAGLTVIQGGQHTLLSCKHTVQAPFAFFNPLRSGSAAYSGFLVDLLGLLLTSAGLNSTDVKYYSPADQSPGAEYTNGSWTGDVSTLCSLESATPPLSVA